MYCHYASNANVIRLRKHPMITGGVGRAEMEFTVSILLRTWFVLLWAFAVGDFRKFVSEAGSPSGSLKFGLEKATSGRYIRQNTSPSTPLIVCQWWGFARRSESSLIRSLHSRQNLPEHWIRGGQDFFRRKQSCSQLRSDRTWSTNSRIVDSHILWGRLALPPKGSRQVKKFASAKRFPQV